MILSFKTKINEKPTYFVEKIHSGILQNLKDQLVNLTLLSFKNQNFDVDKLATCEPKLHTIRKDEKDRWKAGVLIDFFINARQKNMFRFAPQIPVVSTQKIYMSYAFNDIIEITIGGRYIHNFKEKEQLAFNDGFDSYEDFFNYFYPIIKSSENEFYSGKIIHWTDLRY